ncbi:MAG TPA: ankyrin repeat domain-containing protein [Candidatus Babeliales bacterium]|jgi:hypothetical protein|nr:ankyrin repeat domain-containing protein [Candidatus Babeliales bacterium]
MKKCLFLWIVVSVSTVFGMKHSSRLEIQDDDKKCVLSWCENALKSNNFSFVRNILRFRPDLLLDENNAQYERISAIFAEKFIAISSSSSAYSTMKELVHGGFDLDICDVIGRPLLSVAIACEGEKYMDLLKAGVRVNVVDGYGNTPLDYAVDLNDFNKASKLITYGAVVNLDTRQHHPRSLWVKQKFSEQKCVECKTHYFDLSNIPCVNRHLQDGGGHYICTRCYGQRIAHHKGCPLCRRALGKYGS